MPRAACPARNTEKSKRPLSGERPPGLAPEATTVDFAHAHLEVLVRRGFVQIRELQLAGRNRPETLLEILDQSHLPVLLWTHLRWAASPHPATGPSAWQP